MSLQLRKRVKRARPPVQSAEDQQAVSEDDKISQELHKQLVEEKILDCMAQMYTALRQAGISDYKAGAIIRLAVKEIWHSRGTMIRERWMEIFDNVMKSEIDEP